jgi:diacylglycerol kinase family enzyme
MQKKAWAIILNPHAKGGRANELGQDLFKALDKQGIDYKLYLTKVAGGGELSARQCIDDGYRNILIAGGDGSVYDVINGLLSHPLYDAAFYKLAIFYCNSIETLN